MRIEKSKVEILEQEPGIIGMYRFIERAGRVAYKTEDKITEDSWQKFLKMLKERGHWAVFNQGTVYLRFNPAKEMEAWKNLKETKPWTKWTKDADWVNVTTNFRVILQQDLGDFMEKYWTEPDASFYRRIGSLWSCSRATSHQLVRHRVFCLAEGSIIYSSYQKKWKIEDLFEWQSDVKKKGRLKLMNIASVNEKTGIIGNTKIKAIVQTGIKPVYEVKTKSGRSIITTLEHQYYVGNGEYKQLSELKVGDHIMANGKELLENEEWLRDYYLTQNHTRKEMADFIGCCESYVHRAFKKFGIVKPKKDYPNRQPGYGVKGAISEEGRKRISERMSLENNPQWKEDKKEMSARGVSRRHYKKDYCEFCGATENLEQHHWDKNPLNWKESNLVTLCISCHKMVHTIGKATKAIFSDEIISITPVGDKMCYDIEVEGPFHNFVANGLVVHNCYLQASQRYCNYSKDKFGSELTYILPQWIYRVREDIGNTIDSVTYEPRNWILHLDGDHLWDELTLWDRTVAGRDNMWKAIEKEYMAEMLAGDGEKLLPEEARGILPNDIKTELIMTGYKEDWFYEPPKDSPEKAGFFFLRCAHDAQADIRVLAQDLKEQMITKGMNLWK